MCPVLEINDPIRSQQRIIEKYLVTVNQMKLKVFYNVVINLRKVTQLDPHIKSLSDIIPNITTSDQ